LELLTAEMTSTVCGSSLKSVRIVTLARFVIRVFCCRPNAAAASARVYADAGLAVLDRIPDGALAGSHLLPTVRGDLLARAGRHTEAAASFREAASLTRNESEQVVLLRRAAESEQED
jgi:predicted RNA polymerase sigma factor